MTTTAEPFLPAHETAGAETVTLLPPATFFTTWLGTTNHFGLPEGCRIRVHLNRTAWSADFEPAFTSVAQEVQRLRDQIAEVAGLTKQDIARGIGVDRRSLSGFVTGEIRPTEARIHALRALAEIAEWTAARFGDRTRDVLRWNAGSGTALDLIAAGRVELRDELKAIAEVIGVPSKARVIIRPRSHREPAYLKAQARWADRPDKPDVGGTARDGVVYEQDLSRAARSTVTSTDGPRRKRI